MLAKTLNFFSKLFLLLITLANFKPGLEQNMKFIFWKKKYFRRFWIFFDYLQTWLNSRGLIFFANTVTHFKSIQMWINFYTSNIKLHINDISTNCWRLIYTWEFSCKLESCSTIFIVTRFIFLIVSTMEQ